MDEEHKEHDSLSDTGGISHFTPGILHDMSSLLDSIKSSTSQIENDLEKSHLDGIEKANFLLKHYLYELEDPKGKVLYAYYAKLIEVLRMDQRSLKKNINFIQEKLRTIDNIFSLDLYNLEKSSCRLEDTDIIPLLEKALIDKDEFLKKYNVEILRNYSSGDSVIFPLLKQKFLIIMNNLLRNSIEAMIPMDRLTRTLTVEVAADENAQSVSIADTGTGITEDKLNKIFNRGFSDKKEHPGFGLHICSAFMTEMKGDITAASPGEYRGAVFTLKWLRKETGK